MNKTPPKYFLQFFRWFCDPDYVDDIEGDLLERFDKRTQLKKRARWHFMIDVLSLLRPGIIRKGKGSTQFNYYGMITYFLKIGFRNFKKPGAFSSINFLSFSIALAATLLIYQYIDTERKTDSTFTKKDQVFRLVREVEDANSSYRSPFLAAPYRDDFVDALGLSEDKIVRLFKDNELVTVEEKSFLEDNFFYTDPAFLQVLDFPLEIGNPEKVLDKPNTVIISRRIAKKYFESQNPLGKIIEIDNKGRLEISGVFAKTASKSHLDIDFLAPISALGYASWLVKNKEVHAFAYYALSESHRLPTELTGLDTDTRISWQPLSEVYFDQAMESDDAMHGNANFLRSLILIAALILIISGANFLNLILTTSLKKIKDLGVRKVLGSSSLLEVVKLLTETYIIVFFSLLFALGIYLNCAEVFLPQEVHSYYLDSSHLVFIPILTLALTLVFALYPAIITCTIKVSSAAEKKVKHLKVSLLQNGILTFQFGITMLLVVLCVVVTRQFEFLQQKELGINPDQVLYFTSNNKHSYRNLKNIQREVGELKGVKEVAMTVGGLPDSYMSTVTFDIQGTESKRQLLTSFSSLNFPSLLNMEVIEGSLFDPSLKSDIGKTALLNETAARFLGWPDNQLVGRSITPTNSSFEGAEPRKVVGIVKDFHFGSFKNTIEPMAILSTDMEETVIVKLSSADAKRTILDIASIWEKYVPRYPFAYHFLDQKFKALHEADTKQRKVLYLFAGLAIIISIAGLLGLSAYLLQIRRKEIVVRSVLGASTSDLIKLLLAKYLKLLVIAGVSSIPLALFFGSSWLNDFSYRIAFTPDIYLMGTSSVMLLIVFILGIHIIFSTRINPAEELGNE